jgi:hypothetical protein
MEQNMVLNLIAFFILFFFVVAFFDINILTDKWSIVCVFLKEDEYEYEIVVVVVAVI